MNFISVYNTVMKVVFISSATTIVWCIRAHPLVRGTYDQDKESFRCYFLIAESLPMVLIFHDHFTFKEVSVMLVAQKSAQLGTYAAMLSSNIPCSSVVTGGMSRSSGCSSGRSTSDIDGQHVAVTYKLWREWQISNTIRNSNGSGDTTHYIPNMLVLAELGEGQCHQLLILRGTLDDDENIRKKVSLDSRIRDIRLEGMLELEAVTNEMVHLIESAMVPILAVGVDDMINGWNRKITELTGLPIDCAIGKHLLTLVKGCSAAAVKKMIYSALKGNEEQNI